MLIFSMSMISYLSPKTTVTVQPFFMYELKIHSHSLIEQSLVSLCTILEIFSLYVLSILQ